jgi:hypothetical protein
MAANVKISVILDVTPCSLAQNTKVLDALAASTISIKELSALNMEVAVSPKLWYLQCIYYLKRIILHQKLIVNDI